MNYFSPLEQFDVKPVFMLHGFSWIDCTLFDIMLPAFLLIAVLLWFNKVNDSHFFIPTGIYLVVSSFLEFILDIIKKQLNVGAYVYAPFIATLFLIVFSFNILSLIPFGISTTSHLIILLWYSLSLGFTCFVLGLYQKGFTYLKIFVPSCPLALLPVLIIIEFFSYIIRCFSLAIRLAANMLAGHTLMIIIVVFFTVIGCHSYILSSVVLITIIMVTFLELGVCALQAYVITILTCIYLNDIFADSH